MTHFPSLPGWMGSLFLTINLVGCQAAVPVPTPQATEAATRAKPLTQPIDARDLFPQHTIRSHVTFSQGQRKGKTFAFTLEKTSAGWTQTLEGQSVVYLQLHTDGSIVATREDDLREQVAVYYDPYLVIVPARLEQNAHVTGTAKTQVRTLSDGSARGSGTTTYTIDKIWQANLKASDGGTFDAYVVRETRVMSLDVAQVHLTIDTAYASEQGQVRVALWEHQKTLGLFTRDRHWVFSRAHAVEP